MSLELLRKHRRVWADKPVLARVYAPWFAALLQQVPKDSRALEVGAGPGFLGEDARRGRPDARIATMDVLPTPWGDLVGDGLRLPFRDRSLQAVLGLDLVHHLARPAAFFAEVARVLTPGGCLAVVEPWITPLSYPVYRWMHQEGCRLSLDPWDPFGVGEGGKDAFEGDAAVVYRLVRTTSAARWAELGLRPPRVRVLNAFAYLLSLGFKRGSLLPPVAVPTLQALDRALGFAAPLTGLRAFVVWPSLGTGQASGDEHRGGR